MGQLIAAREHVLCAPGCVPRTRLRLFIFSQQTRCQGHPEQRYLWHATHKLKLCFVYSFFLALLTLRMSFRFLGTRGVWWIYNYYSTKLLLWENVAFNDWFYHFPFINAFCNCLPRRFDADWKLQPPRSFYAMWELFRHWPAGCFKLYRKSSSRDSNWIIDKYFWY